MFAQCVAQSLVAVAEILGVAVVYAALVVGPVVEPARISASDEVAVIAGRLAPGLGPVAERVRGAAVAVDTGVVSCAAAKIDGSESAAAPVEVDILDFEVWRELFAAAKKLDWAAFAGRAVAVTRRAVGTSAAGDAIAVAGTAAVAVAADTSYSAALSVPAGAAIHSPAVYTARQLAASDDLQMHFRPSHIPDKPSASPRTAPSVAVEDTPAAAVALVVVEASYSIAAAAVAVAGS